MACVDEGRQCVLAIVAASEHGRRFVRWSTRKSPDRRDDRRCGSVGGIDHAENRRDIYQIEIVQGKELEVVALEIQECAPNPA
jgi:hypothetical protein